MHCCSNETSFASNASMFIVFGGLLLGMAKLLMVGVVLYALIALFQMVTLPVEYDASHRAKLQLQRLGLVSAAELPHVGKVLNAAALTYVAALVAAVLQLLHLVMLARGMNRD